MLGSSNTNLLFAPRSEAVEGDTPVHRLESETGGGACGQTASTVNRRPQFFRTRLGRDRAVTRGSCADLFELFT
jgi:hypothetical protein